MSDVTWFWGINTIALPDRSVYASHSLWLSVKFLMKLIIVSVSGGRSVQRLWLALITLICSLSEGRELVPGVAVGMSRDKAVRRPNNKMQLILSGISNCATDKRLLCWLSARSFSHVMRSKDKVLKKLSWTSTNRATLLAETIPLDDLNLSDRQRQVHIKMVGHVFYGFAAQ